MTKPISHLLIDNALCVATCNEHNTRIAGGAVLIEDNRIVAVGPAGSFSVPPGASRIDASNHVVIPGLVNCHHHHYQVLTRVLPSVQNAKLFDWLVGLYPIWAGLTPEAEYWASMAALGELLLTGCTTAADHHYLIPRHSTTGIIEAEVRAAQTLGIRFHPTRGSMSRGRSKGGLPPDHCVQDEDAILADCERLIDAVHDPAPFSMTRLALAPCSPFSVTLDLMKETARLARARGVRLHTHLAETHDETEYCLANYGMRPVALMETCDWLGHDVWFVHCVTLDDAEVSLFAKTGTGVAHCPSSNMRLGSGIAPIPKLLKAGGPVGMGVDGSSSNDSSNMLGELQRALLLHRVVGGADATTCDDVLAMGTRGGARLLGRDDIGVIAPGMAADVAMFRLDRLPYIGAAVHDPVAALLMCGASTIADVVVVNGRIVVRDGRLVFGAEDEIVERANAAARALIARANSSVGA